MKTRFIWDANREQVVDANEYERPARISGPFGISDTAEPFKSMADGKVYDSKSRYRAELRARGYEEVGNERTQPKPVPIPDFSPVFWKTAAELRNR